MRDACTELKKRWSASLRDHPKLGTAGSLKIRHPEQPSLSASVALHNHHIAPFGRPALLIEFEPPTTVAFSSPRAVPQNFTLRERDLIRLVCEGKSNQEIASEAGKAVGSVKNALHTIFGKAGVNSRSALVAQQSGARKKRGSPNAGE